MAVPAKRDIYRPVLEIAAASGEILNRKQVVGQVIDRLALTEDDLRELVPSGVQTRVDNRMNWAITDLKLAGLLLYPKLRHLQITPQGREFLTDHPGVITEAEVAKLRTNLAEDSPAAVAGSTEVSDITPDEQIARSHQQHQEMLADEILSHLKGISPAGFERLVNELLREMGYGTIEQGQGFSGDHGVDGILNQDTLGLEKIYVQAKRWDNTPVGEPDISRFSGSLDLKGATKGVFITTSTFSSAAKAYTENNRSSKTIRPIDGRELAELMIKHGVGVVTEITYEVKKLDANYFAEV